MYSTTGPQVLTNQLASFWRMHSFSMAWAGTFCVVLLFVCACLPLFGIHLTTSEFPVDITSTMWSIDNILQPPSTEHPSNSSTFSECTACYVLRVGEHLCLFHLHSRKLCLFSLAPSLQFHWAPWSISFLFEKCPSDEHFNVQECANPIYEMANDLCVPYPTQCTWQHSKANPEPFNQPLYSSTFCKSAACSVHVQNPPGSAPNCLHLYCKAIIKPLPHPSQYLPMANYYLQTYLAHPPIYWSPTSDFKGLAFGRSLATDYTPN